MKYSNCFPLGLFKTRAFSISTYKVGKAKLTKKFIPSSQNTLICKNLFEKQNLFCCKAISFARCATLPNTHFVGQRVQNNFFSINLKQKIQSKRNEITISKSLIKVEKSYISTQLKKNHFCLDTQKKVFIFNKSGFFVNLKVEKLKSWPLHKVQSHLAKREGPFVKKKKFTFNNQSIFATLKPHQKTSFFQGPQVNKNVNNSFSTENIENMSGARIIVITSGKGGVGKTTATANLGMSMARLGYRVALIDADIGLRNLDLLLGLENRVLYTAMDILEGQCRLDQALIRDKRWKNLALLAISKNRQRYNVTRKNMENLVNSISALGYQFILIDCPAGIDIGFINAISPAQEAVIVTTPEITAIRDADRVAGLLEANGIYNVKLLVNRVRPDMIQRNDMMSVKDVQEMLGIPLLGAIPEDTHVIISTNRGEPLVLKKKLTLSGIAFENAARRLIGKQDYFLDLGAPYKGVFQKVQEFFLGNK